MPAGLAEPNIDPVQHRIITGWSDEGNFAAALETLAGPPWMAEAACKGSTSVMFLTGRGNHTDKIRRARQLCAGCKVFDQCKAYALELPQVTTGIFAGMTKRQRNKAARDRHSETLTEAACGLPNGGKDGGYYSHRYRGQKPCSACTAAHTAAENARNRAKRPASLPAIRRTDREHERYYERREQGWCSKCAGSRHTLCRGATAHCDCPRCNKIAQLAAPDQGGEGAPRESMSSTVKVGVETSKEIAAERTIQGDAA